MKYDSLFAGFSEITLMPPCGDKVPDAIRGIRLPREYAEFLAEHDGARLVYDRSSLELDPMYVELFSVSDMLTGARYRDSFGGYLGSELTMREDFQNPHVGMRTTANGTPYDDAPELFKRFYDDHLVIGCAWSPWDDDVRYIAPLAISRDGAYILAYDDHIERGAPEAWRGASLRELLEQAREL